MVKHSAIKSIIPRIDGRALDIVKAGAAVLMVVDHINLIWFKDEILEMTLAGRVVFPLFCYAVATALLRHDTPKHRQKYLTSLLVLGFLSEPIVELARPDSPLNVIFTLAFGVFIAGLVKHMKDWQIGLMYAAAAIASVFLQVPIEFSLSGVMVPSALMLVMQGKNRFFPFVLLLLFTINAAGLRQSLEGAANLSMWSPDVLQMAFVLGFFATAIPYAFVWCAKDLPQTGRYLSRYSLHVFYPGHQLVLWLLGLLFFPK